MIDDQIETISDGDALRMLADTFGDIEAVQWGGEMSTAVVNLVMAGHELFPLWPRGKTPRIAKAAGGRGVLDATDDLDQLLAWWSRWPDANIGCRVPAGLVVVDIDPRKGGMDTWNKLVAGRTLPATRTTISGRDDGGVHLWWRHPGGDLVGSLGDGIDTRTRGHYVVVPPSIHDTTGNPYRWADPVAGPAVPPSWLARALRKKPAVPKPALVATAQPAGYDGDSPADWYCGATTWADVLEPHGWSLVNGDGDGDGSGWKHPTASSPLSATVRHGLLFVYSPNTPLPVTEAGNPNGLTRFRVWALLDHSGDMSAAAKAAMTQRNTGWVK